MIKGIRNILTNKVIWYLLSRYFTYFIQFITSVIIAVKLGPYYMGVWGFIMLLLNYFQQIHFGIANSLNVLLIHNKDNQQKSDSYITNSMVLVAGLSLVVALIAIYYYYFGIESFQKYGIGNYFYGVCLIAILQYFNGLFINILRVKNEIIQVAICQSMTIFLNFACIFFFTGETLITSLLWGNIIGNIFCVALAYRSKIVPAWHFMSISTNVQKVILRKGLYLFLYNSCFYFIIISVRTLISYHYSVEEFGYFTFSFSLANAIMLLLDALSFIIFPKVVNKLSSDNIEEVETVLNKLRFTYISSAHFLVYLALLFFPLLLLFMPKYAVAWQVLNLIALAVLMNANSFGYSTLLIARNKEKYSAIISFATLFLNCVLGLILVNVFDVKYSFVILSTMLSYLFFSYIVTVVGSKLIGKYNMKVVLKSFFPLRLFIPYMIALMISVFSWKALIFLPLVMYIGMNFKDMLVLKDTIVKIIKKPNIINI